MTWPWYGQRPQVPHLWRSVDRRRLDVGLELGDGRPGVVPPRLKVLRFPAQGRELVQGVVQADLHTRMMGRGGAVNIIKVRWRKVGSLKAWRVLHVLMSYKRNPQTRGEAAHKPSIQT